MNLRELKPRRLRTGQRFTFYGPESVGKSSLAAYAPKPVFIDVEDGTGNLEVVRYPFRDGPLGHVPPNYTAVLDAVRAIATEPHDFETLVIDTLDRLEALIWAHILDRDSGRQGALNKSGKRIESIESYGYGKGYILALDVWRDLCRALDELRLKRTMNVVLLGHAAIRTFKNPEGEDYDRYHLRINDKAAGFIKEWSDVVGFCTFEEGGAKLDADQPRAKGYSTGRRLIKLSRTAAYDAKSRIPLPDEVELAAANPWAPLADAVRVGLDVDPEHLHAAIEAELERINDDALSNRVVVAMSRAGDDVGTLARYLNTLKNKPEVNHV